MKVKIVVYTILFIILGFTGKNYAAVNLIIDGGIVPNGMNRGGVYPITIYVKNTGSTSTNTSFFVNISINTSSSYNGNQTYLLDIPVSGGILSGQTKTLNATITIPCSYSAGIRYILAGADAINNISESSETDNNFGFSILLQSQIDLTPMHYSLSTSSITAGNSLTTIFAVNNEGATTSGSFNAGFYLSSSSTLIVGQAVYLGGYSVSWVGGCAQTLALNRSLTIPSNTCTGNYYIHLWVDDNQVISEFENTNNFQHLSISISGTSSPSTPSTTSPSNTSATSFTANWNNSSGATTYFLDVATNSSFSNLISGYSNLNVGNSTSRNITGLNCSTTYYYRLRAGNNCGASASSSTITVTTSPCCTAPSAPSANSASSIAATSFNASWNTSSGATAYYIDVSTSSGFSSLVYNNQSVGNTTSYNFSGLNCNTIYYYRVRANNSCGTSGNSSTITVPTGACCTAPSAPSANSASSITTTSFNANWNTSSGTTAYYVDVSTSSGFSSFVYNNQSIGNTTSYNFSGLNCNTTYYYRVRANNSCATSGNSSTITVSTNACCTAPSSPSTSSASSITATSFNASWNTSSGATAYYLDVSTSSGFSSYVYNNQSVGNTTSYNFSGLNCNTTYYYRVRANNSCGTSGNSSSITVTTSACCATPSAPSAPSASGITTTSFNANWNTSSGATAYYIDVSTSSGFSSFVYNNQSVGNTTSQNFSGLNCNTIYYYRVRSNNICGTSVNSSTITVTTNACFDPSLAVPQQIISPVGTPMGIIGCTCINQSHYSINPTVCQARPNSAQYGWQFWQRGDCYGPGHGASTGIGGADDRFAWDCNMNLPDYNLDNEQNVYAVEDGYIMTNADNTGWGNISTGQLLIKHTNGSDVWYSGYLHMTQITSKKFASTLAGRHVFAGEIIGVISNVSQNNMTPHLHFAVYYDDPIISNKLRSVDRTVQTRLVPASEFRLAVIGSIVSGAEIFIKRGSIWKNYGRTDENGNAQILLMPSIQQGDSLKIVASGYEEIILGIDSSVIVGKKIVVPLMEQLTPPSTIMYPSVIALDQKTFYDNATVNLKLLGHNFINYDVIRIIDFGDSTGYNTVISNNLLQDSLFFVNLVDTGINTFQFLFKGVDSCSIFKSFQYAPNTSNFYSVGLNISNQFIGSNLYVDGSFIKTLQFNNDNVSLLNGNHFLTIQAVGYRDSTFIVNSASIINIVLDSFSYSSISDSIAIDFTTTVKIRYHNNVTVMDSAMLSIISIMEYDDNFLGMGLIPKSRKFEIQHLNSNWSDIRFAAVLDQIEILSEDSIYLMRVYDDTLFTKISFDTMNIAAYDSMVQKLTYNYVNFNNGTSDTEALIIMKRLGPIVHSVLPLQMNQGSQRKMALSQFFSDPDSLHNDMIYNVTNSLSQINIQIVGDSVVIIPDLCWNGNDTLEISAQHDGLWKSTLIPIIVNPKPLPFLIPSTNSSSFCSGDSVILTPSIAGVSYLWSNNDTVQSIEIKTSGNYWIQVIDSLGCMALSPTISMNEMPAPTPIVYTNGSTAFCSGDSVILSSSILGSSYLWSNNSITPTISVSRSGSFSVQVTDVNSCVGTSAVITISEYSLPRPKVYNIGATTFCSGKSVILSSSISGVNYLWSNGSTSHSILVSSTGKYSIQVSDLNGCTGGSDTISVIEHIVPIPKIEVIGTTTFCTGGSVMLSSAIAGVSYLWSNNATTQNIIAESTGIYSVQVKDDKGCIGLSEPIRVTEYPLPIVDAGNSERLLMGSSTIIGGIPTAKGNGPFIYNWSPTEGLDAADLANPTASPSATSVFTIFVTDANGCSSLDSMMVFVDTDSRLQIFGNDIVVYPNPTRESLTISGSKVANGEYHFQLIDSEGRVVFECKMKVVNNSLNEQMSLTNLSSGVYSLIVENGKNRYEYKVQKTN